MRKALLATTAGLAGMLLGAVAMADEITLGQSIEPNKAVAGYLFYGGGRPGTPNGSVYGTLTGYGTTDGGLAAFGDDPAAGSYHFGPTSIITTGPLDGTGFSINATQPLYLYNSAGSLSLMGQVTWSKVTGDNSPDPELIGSLAVLTSTGDQAWTDSFPTGGTSAIDLELAYLARQTSGLTLDELSRTDMLQLDTLTIASGMILPAVAPADPPSSAMISAVPAPAIGHGVFVLLAVISVLCGGKLMEHLRAIG